MSRVTALLSSRRRRALLALIVAVVVLGTAGTALAFWTTSASGNGAASADTVNAGNTPSGSATGGSVTISWSATTTAAAHAVQGYVITRYDAPTGGTATPAGNGCSGTVTALSCTETGLSTGTFYYTVTPKLQNWLGAESARSSAIHVDTTPPTVDSINRAGASSTVNSGPLTWTVTFSEPVNGATTSNFALGTSNIGGTAPSITSVSATGGAPSATWSVSVATTGTTGTNSGSIGLNLANNTGIKDVANNNLSTATFSGQAYTYDTTAPTRTALEMFDNNNNGKVDTVVVTYNETLAATPIGTWSLANVPSGGTLNTGSISISGSAVTLPITEGAGAANTAVGTFTVALTGTPPKDLAGNAVATFAATAPADKAQPVATAVTLVNGGGAAGAGKIDGKADSIAFTFSESLHLSTVCSGGTGWSSGGTDGADAALTGNNVVTVTVTDAGTNDTLTASATRCTFHLDSVTLGGNYVTATSTFSGTGSNASSIQWTESSKKLTITFGALATGTLNGTAQAAGTPSYAPSASITDPAANAAASWSGTYSTSRF